ncbi:hypothetical protein ACTHSJ_33425 [Paenibacillus cellulositrophicus]|uniref:hypothetical protein n=1 Tax=Paenibacillus cellulositrophicus TaxID=562959 RepID=UPI003F803BAD
MRKTIISGLLVVIVLMGFSIYLNQLNSDLKELRQANDELVNSVSDLTSKVHELQNSVGTQSVFSIDDIQTRFDDLQGKVEKQDGRIFDLELWSE